MFPRTVIQKATWVVVVPVQYQTQEAKGLQKVSPNGTKQELNPKVYQKKIKIFIWKLSHRAVSAHMISSKGSSPNYKFCQIVVPFVKQIWNQNLT